MSFITLQEAQDMVSRYQTLRPDIINPDLSTDVLPLNITFSKTEVLHLLAQDDAAQLRIYFGVQGEDDLIDLVLVAADANGDDIIPTEDYLLLDQGTRCPVNCPSSSVLTSNS
jgi:hypothetical protein